MIQQSNPNNMLCLLPSHDLFLVLSESYHEIAKSPYLIIKIMYAIVTSRSFTSSTCYKFEATKNKKTFGNVLDIIVIEANEILSWHLISEESWTM